MSRMLLSGTHSVYIGRIPGEEPTWVQSGDLLVDLALSKRGGLVIGIRTLDGTDELNPPKHRVLEPGTLLIYLAETPSLESPA